MADENCKTPSLADKKVADLMAKIQVFASAWALVGTRFDSGDGYDDARVLMDDIESDLTAAIGAAK